MLLLELIGQRYFQYDMFCMMFFNFIYRISYRTQLLLMLYQNWIGAKIAYWCKNETLRFRNRKDGAREKYIFSKCQQEGGLPPWWTISAPLPECIENKGNVSDSELNNECKLALFKQYVQQLFKNDPIAYCAIANILQKYNQVLKYNEILEKWNR